MSAFLLAIRAFTLFLICFLGVCRAAMSADLEQLYDAGGTVPAAPYFGHLISGAEQRGVLPGFAFPMVSRLVASSDTARTLPSKAIFKSAWMAQPIFLVGADNVSHAWLQRHRAALLVLGANGVIVQAKDEPAFKRMQQAADGLTVGPSRGGWLEQTLLKAGVKTYPLLIQTDGRIAAQPAMTTQSKAEGS